MNQKMTEAEIEASLQDKVRTKLNCFHDIWNRMGIGSETRIGRLNTMDKHLTELLDDMLKEENGALSLLQNTIGELKLELDRLCAELHSPFFQQIEQNRSLLEVREFLESKVKELSDEKKERLGKLKELCAAERVLCDRLGVSAKTVTNDVPSLKEIECFGKNVKELEKEVMNRTKTLEKVRHCVLQLLMELELSPETDFERTAAHTEVDRFILSDNNMKELDRYFEKLHLLKSEARQLSDKLKEDVSKLWDQLGVAEVHREEFLKTFAGCDPHTINALKDELKRCRQLRAENLCRLTEESKEKLRNLWELCFYSKEQMDEFRPYFDDTPSEETLHLIDVEVTRLEQLYERKKNVFDKVKQRQELWSRFLELEQSSTDPSRFNNRGGQLLKEEKERSRLTKELPKLEKRLIGEIREWEATSGSFFLIEDVRFEDYVARQWDTYRAEKENEKKMKQLQKVKQLEKESLFGSKIASPRKRPMNSNISVIAPKLRRMNEIQGTPSKVRHIPSSGLSTHSIIHSKVLSDSRRQVAPGSSTMSKGLATPNKRDTPGGLLKIPNTSTPNKPPVTPSRWQTPSNAVFHLLL